MKIRTLTLGIPLSYDNFTKTTINDGSLKSYLYKFKMVLDNARIEFTKAGYLVQTLRFSFNSPEEWLLGSFNLFDITSMLSELANILRELEIDFCSIGTFTSKDQFHWIPKILSISSVFSCSISMNRQIESQIAPSYEYCYEAAKICLDIYKQNGENSNFNFCSSFNCISGIPFFPASYHKGPDPSLSIGFESGDLLFLAFHGADTHEEGRDNLSKILHDSFFPVQEMMEAFCEKNSIIYGGIDASINPGLTPIDSVGTGLENLIFPKPQTPPLKPFGSFGTLAAVSAVTGAIRSIASPNSSAGHLLKHIKGQESPGTIKLTGYSGLMLPVMEDLTLAERALEGHFNMRDIMFFSSCCGVGIDTIPIPGDTTPEQLAQLYQEVGALAFKLDKPLTCRVLPLSNKKPGDIAKIYSPYLCDTVTFSL